MSQHEHPQFQTSDELLLRRLAAAITDRDPVPDQTFVHNALDLRVPHAELAELHADSALDPPAGLRSQTGGDSSPRRLDFHCQQLRVQIEVTNQGRRRDIAGNVHSSPPVTSVEIRWPSGYDLRCVADSGDFSTPAVPAGPLSVLCHRPGAAPVATSWICV